MKARIALCVILAVLVAVVQVIELRDRVQRTELGEDADFDVKTWRWACCCCLPQPPFSPPARSCPLFSWFHQGGLPAAPANRAFPMSSKQHRVNVGDGHLDRASVKSIWSSPNKAWKGIDSILPTGGRYGYEEDHLHTADQAKMLHFLEGAKKQVAKMRAAMPKVSLCRS